MNYQLGKTREKVKYGEDRAAAKCVEHFIDAGNCHLWDLRDLFQFLVIDGDSNAARHFGDAYQGAQPKGSGMLDEANSNVGIKGGVDLFREDWFQSERARLDRLCSRGSFNSEGSQGAFSVIQFGRRKDNL